MINFCESAGSAFDPPREMFATAALDRRCFLCRLLICCDGMLATRFRARGRSFSCSRSSLSNFGTTPLVHVVHFFLDFIFH